jgi:hypothetical protein
MAKPQEFEQHIFISYRHQDNDLRDENNKGWVDHFHQDLEDTLKGILVKPPKIWRDTRLPGNVYIAEHLGEKLKKTAVLVSVLSPSYLDSNWCLGELKEFCRMAQNNGGLKIDGQLRIFKIMKTLIESSLPIEFENQTGFPFFTMLQGKEWPDDFRQGRGQHSDARYWEAINELAWAIKKALALICPEVVTPTEGTINVFNNNHHTSSKGTVYLAQTTLDLQGDRNNIRRELESDQYQVLPDKEIPLVSPDYEQQVAKAINQSTLSIHLIGGRYASIPEGEPDTKTILQLQIDASLNRKGETPFSRLIWMPAEMDVTDPRQIKFIDILKHDSNLQTAADFLITKREDLKQAIREKLDPPVKQALVQAGENGSATVYLMCDQTDFPSLGPILDCLAENGFNVTLPLLGEVSKAEFDDYHFENLRICDAVLIYHGLAPITWLQTKQMELIKLPGMRKGNPACARGLYLSAPESDLKNRLSRNVKAVVIKGYNGFEPPTLRPFMAEIDRVKGEAR